ncbi:Hypothetical protein R9X50_00649300 [Acrodontium crateriforme]|uniref:Uncharacterized protein n=1 Tax=Acrodontium crateriforme TaxID=150365 RepID=A0AAQ3M990_9PEZI|nr:Hypothetical protein R9X50_00649300 [Acrodontium crateriforme]
MTAVPFRPASLNNSVIADPVCYKSPNRPRPGKPVQPRDDGCYRAPSSATVNKHSRIAPQPRDPPSGHPEFAMAHRNYLNSCIAETGTMCNTRTLQSRSANAPRRRDPNPRDPGN